MSQEVIDLITANDKTTNITIVSDESFPYITDDESLAIPTFSFIKELKLKFRCNNKPTNYQPQSIREYFPNLTQLALDITGVDFDYFKYNEFIKINLLSFNRLDKLFLILNYFEDRFGFFAATRENFPIIWSNFSNVSCLILDSNNLSIGEIDFGALPNTLNEIRFYCYGSYDLKYIEDNINVSKNWDIKLKNGFIYFTK
jgi:hypothetical protein